MIDIGIQKDLDKLLFQVQKDLKKRMFPRKHTKLLWNSVEICLGDLGEKNYKRNTLGTYEVIENEEHKHKFSHKIIINEWVYDEYKNGLDSCGNCKRYTKQRIKETIAHELIHAYTYEKYEFCGEYGFHCDGSPIFLSILVFLDIPSGHKPMKGFKHTEIYKRVKEVKTFEQLETYLFVLTCKYEKKFKELNVIQSGDGKAYGNSFQFSSGNITGLKGTATSSAILDKKIGKANFFTLGPNANIENLQELVLSKVNRNVFEHNYGVQNVECANIEDRKIKLKLQSMNI